MASMGLLGAIGGAGEGAAKIGEMLLSDDLEKLRQERMSKLQDKRDEKLFGQKKEMANIQQENTKEIKVMDYDEKQKDRDLTVSEGDKDRASKESLQRIKEQAAQDKEAAESGKPTTNWRKYEELKAKYLRDNDGKLSKEADNHLLSLAYGADERINTKNNEVIFTGLLGDGSPGVTAEYGRPVDELGNETGSRRDREFRTVPDPTAKKPTAPAAPEGYAPARLPQNMQGQKDGRYSLKDGRILLIQDGQGYISN